MHAPLINADAAASGGSSQLQSQFASPSVEQALLLTGAELDDIQANHAYMLRPDTTDASGRRRLRSTKEVLRREWPGRRRLWYTSASSVALQVATSAMAVAETLAAEAQAEAERVQTALNAAAVELQQISNDMDSVPTQVMDGSDATVAARMRHLVVSLCRDRTTLSFTHTR